MQRDSWPFIKAFVAGIVLVTSLFVLEYAGFSVSPDVAFVSVAIGALFVFVLTSNRLRQLSAPGGISAIFSEAAEAPAEARGITDLGPADGEEFVLIQKRGLDQLEGLTKNLGENDFAALRLRLGRYGTSGHQYDPESVLEYVRTLAAITSNSFVLFIDQNDRFIGAVEANRFLKLSSQQVGELLRDLQNEDTRRLLRNPVVQEASAPTSIGNRDALELMRAKRIRFLVLVDKNRVPIKIATKEQIIERLILALGR